MIRDTLKTALTESMKARDTARTATLRLIQAAIKNRDIELRTAASPSIDDDALVADVLQKMAKQRRESIALFESGNRPDLAAAEQAELAVIEAFLPHQMDAAEASAAIAGLIAEAGATTPRDMGAVMALVRARLAGRIDMGQASALVKAALSGA